MEIPTQGRERPLAGLGHKNCAYCASASLTRWRFFACAADANDSHYGWGPNIQSSCSLRSQLTGEEGLYGGRERCYTISFKQIY